MQRSASTLQYQIAAEIVERYDLGKRVGWISPDKHGEILHLHDDDRYKVLKSHLLTDPIKHEINLNNSICLYIYRDLRDVICSLQKKNDTIYTGKKLEALINSLIDQYYGWIKTRLVYVSQYEKILNNIIKEINGISKFIGVLLSDGELYELAEKFSIDRQTERIIRNRSLDNLIYVNEYNIYDPDTLLHTNHISSGKIGCYKEILTDEQIEIIKGNSFEWLQMHGYF